MAQKMAENKQNAQQQQIQETFGLEEIIPAILESALPRGKKVAFLYMIAEGTFSLQQLEDISLELEVIGEKMEAEVWRKKAEIMQLEQKIAGMNQQLDVLAVDAAKEHQQTIDAFLTATADYVEGQQGVAEQQQIADIQKGLSQE